MRISSLASDEIRAEGLGTRLALFSVLDKVNPCFRDLLKTLDSVSSDLHRQEIGATKHSAPITSQEHEELFWKKVFLDCLHQRYSNVLFSFMLV